MADYYDHSLSESDLVALLKRINSALEKHKIHRWKLINSTLDKHKIHRWKLPRIVWDKEKNYMKVMVPTQHANSPSVLLGSLRAHYNPNEMDWFQFVAEPGMDLSIGHVSGTANDVARHLVHAWHAFVTSHVNGRIDLGRSRGHSHTLLSLPAHENPPTPPIAGLGVIDTAEAMWKFAPLPEWSALFCTLTGPPTMVRSVVNLVRTTFLEHQKEPAVNEVH